MDILGLIGSAFTPELVATILTTLIGLVITTLLGAAVGFVRAHTTAEQFKVIENVAAMAVKAAEQGEIGGFVQDKKASAINAASVALSDRGIRISPAALDAAIEAAVLEAFNSTYASTPVEPKADDSVAVQPEVSGA